MYPRNSQFPSAPAAPHQGGARTARPGQPTLNGAGVPAAVRPYAHPAHRTAGMFVGARDPRQQHAPRPTQQQAPRPAQRPHAPPTAPHAPTYRPASQQVNARPAAHQPNARPNAAPQLAQGLHAVQRRPALPPSAAHANVFGAGARTPNANVQRADARAHAASLPTPHAHAPRHAPASLHLRLPAGQGPTGDGRAPRQEGPLPFAPAARPERAHAPAGYAAGLASQTVQRMKRKRPDDDGEWLPPRAPTIPRSRKIRHRVKGVWYAFYNRGDGSLDFMDPKDGCPPCPHAAGTWDVNIVDPLTNRLKHNGEKVKNTRYQHFKVANAEREGAYPPGAGGGSPSYKYTWHHHKDKGRMQLIDRDVHAAFTHVGGFEFWGS